MKRIGVMCILLIGLAASGCSSYYRVTNPETGKVYHTRKIDQSRRGGYIEFKDAVTKEKVTLQSSQVKKVSKYEFDRDTH